MYAPARGATVLRCIPQRAGWDFNPRSRERSDEIFQLVFFLEDISIHAPARGATAILTKNPFDFLAKIDKIYYYLLPFSFYNILSFLSRTLFMHFSGANLPAILCVPPIRTSVFRYNFK